MVEMFLAMDVAFVRVVCRVALTTSRRGEMGLAMGLAMGLVGLLPLLELLVGLALLRSLAFRLVLVLLLLLGLLFRLVLVSGLLRDLRSVGLLVGS